MLAFNFKAFSNGRVNITKLILGFIHHKSKTFILKIEIDIALLEFNKLLFIVLFRTRKLSSKNMKNKGLSAGK